MIHRGEIWWATLPEPVGSEPGFRRPLLILQTDSFNRSRIQTTVGVVLTSNLALAESPGKVDTTRWTLAVASSPFGVGCRVPVRSP